MNGLRSYRKHRTPESTIARRAPHVTRYCVVLLERVEVEQPIAEVLRRKLFIGGYWEEVKTSCRLKNVYLEELPPRCLHELLHPVFDHLKTGFYDLQHF